MERTITEQFQETWRIRATVAESSLRLCVTFVNHGKPTQGTGSNPIYIHVVRTDGRWTAMRG